MDLISVFCVGLGASLLGSMAGGGSLLVIPALMLLGLPASMAIATNKFGTVGLYLGSTPKFWRAEKIVWAYVPAFVALACLGVAIGSSSLLNIDPSTLTRLVGLVVLLVLPVVLLNKDWGTRRMERSSRRKYMGYFVYFLVMIFSGFFGGGAAIFVFNSLIFFFGFTLNEANGTTALPFLISSIISLAIFAWGGILDYSVGITLALGAMVGGHLGSHLAIQKGNAWVKVVFAIVLGATGVKFLFF